MKTLAIYVAHHISKTSLEVTRRGLRQITDTNTAATRLAICKGCPHYTDWSKGCSPCQVGSEVGIQNAIEPRRVLPGSEKFACGIAKDSLAISVFDLNPIPIQTAPDVCWRKGAVA